MKYRQAFLNSLPALVASALEIITLVPYDCESKRG
jgi:hypothetical protein